MASRYFDQPQREIQNVQASQARQRNVNAYADQDDEDLAKRIGAIAKEASWITPDAAFSLAKAGVTPDDPDFDKIAKAAGAVKTKKKGFGWHSFGDAITATGKGAYTGFKGVSRATWDVASYVPQTAIGAVRTVHENFEDNGIKGAVLGPLAGGKGADAILDQTNLGQIGNKVVEARHASGQSNLAAANPFNAIKNAANADIQTGNGFFTNRHSEIGKAQSAAARAAWTIDGDRAFTLGRFTAQQVTEPGSWGYNMLSGLIDATTTVALDPTNAGIGLAVQTRNAKKVFNSVDDVKAAAGLVEGGRKAIIAQKADKWLTSKDGAKVLDHIAGSDFKTLYKTFHGQVPTESLVKLADAATPQQADALLRPMLGLNVNKALEMPGFVDKTATNVTKAVFKRDPRSIRLLQMMPGDKVNLDDLDDAVTQVQRFAQNANLPEAVRLQRVEEMARAVGRNERWGVIKNLSDDVAEQLTSVHGLDRTAARKLTRNFHGNNDAARKYFVDSTTGLNKPVVGAKIDGNDFVLPTPHLYAETIGQYAPLPDARDIREATTKWGRFLSGKPVTVTTADGVKRTVPLSEIAGKTLGGGKALTDTIINGAWKKSVLLRPAYTVRVVGEEQLRMAGARMDSLFSHPLSAIAYVTGRKGHLALTGDDIADASRLADDVDEFAAAQSRGSDYRLGGRTMHSQDETFSIGNLDQRDDYIKSWADQLMKLRGDAVTKKALGDWGDEATDIDDFAAAAKDDFWNGALKGTREDMAKAPGKEALATSRADADKYVDSLIDRANQMTNGDTDLMQALLTGKLGDEAIRDGFKPSAKLIAHLTAKAEEGIGPSLVAGQKTYMSNTDKGVQALTDAVDWMFTQLASKPTNKLSRSPVFKQTYWKKTEELLPYMDAATQKLTLESAKKANVGRIGDDVIGRMKLSVQGGAGDLTAAEADMLAKAHALKTTQNLLFDVTRRSQFFDAYRLVFAFGDAWKEVLTTWAKILPENPAMVHKGQQGIFGGQNADMDGNGQGFFYKDPTTGEEMFTIPGSRWANAAVSPFVSAATGNGFNSIGTGVPFSSPVKGLNIFGTFLPSVGPAIQVPAGALIPDVPQADFIQKLIFPMGEVDREAGSFVESWYPAWIKKIVTGFGEGSFNEKQWNNTVTNIMGQLVDQGKYDISNPDDMTEALDEARDKAKVLFILQGAAQSTAPSPPTQDFLVHNQDGRLVMMDLIKNDLNKMYEEDRNNGTSNATQRFVDKYGTDLLLAMQPKSEQVKGYVPVTKAAKDWSRNNTELAQKYPKVYGLFAPSDGDFDIDEYSRQFRAGDRKTLSPDEVLKNTQATIGNFMYKQAKAKIGNRNDAEAKAYLAKERDDIIDKYPGYGYQSFSTTETKTLISELQRAHNDPLVAATDAGQGFALYMKAREKALASTGGKPYSASKKTQPVRDWLNQIGEAIVAEHPDFQNQWDRVFAREVSKNTNEEDDQ